MVPFSFRNRDYAVDFEIHKGRRMLVIVNPENKKLEVSALGDYAVAKSPDGSRQHIDLSTDRNAAFYNGLIEEARASIERHQLEADADSFFQQVAQELEEHAENFNKTLNIAVIGNVSSGKSSLVNALLMRTRTDPLAEVGVKAGVTTKLNVFRLDERVRLIDSPGLGDIRSDHSRITQEFLKSIDLGILVVTGAADAAQKQYFDDLRQSCSCAFLVLNKIDEWDKYTPQALDDVVEQWKHCLGAEMIYPVCTLGYDPQLASAPLDIRGVDALRRDIEAFLDTKGKKLLLARHMKEKKSYAIGIIVTAVTVVGIEAALPGKALFITATQIVAITSLYYLYTGTILSKGAAFSLLPVFAGKAVATQVFLFFASFIPPTGVVEVAAAITAITITAAMLASVNFALSTGISLTDDSGKAILAERFVEYRVEAKKLLTALGKTNIWELRNIDWHSLISQLLEGTSGRN